MKNLSPSRRRWVKVRLSVLLGILLLGAGRVAVRAYELQIDRATSLREMAEDQYLRQVRLAPKRGTITDRNGTELAVSVDVESVWASPHEIHEAGGDPAQIARELHHLLGVDRDVIERRLSRETRHFAWIKRRLTPRLAQQVRELDLPGVHLDREARRFYPNGRLASHILGFANVDGVGIEGLELSLEQRLRGESQSAEAIRDRRGRIVFSEQLLDDRAARGEDISLTIDAEIQRVAERELALGAQTFEAEAGSVVVMDPNTGEILALANYPNFDPNVPGRFPASHRRNRAITDRFEPGSTVKPFTVAAALARGTIGPEQQIDCMNGEMEIDEYTIHDTTPHDHLTPAQILTYSSNIGTAQIGRSLGRRGLYRAFRRFGFGQVTTLPMPGEARGILRDYRRWYEMDAATISFGQGMSVTSAQLATAMSVIANGGTLVEPRLIRSSDDGTGVLHTRREVRRRVVPSDVARLVGDMLTAVTGPGGTAERAAIDGYLVAGKTGTAQKADYARGGYSDDRWVASFVGFVPAENPRLVISVVIDEPVIAHYGGLVAGPIFRRVGEAALRHLGVPATTGGEILAQRERRRRRIARIERRLRRAARRHEAPSTDEDDALEEELPELASGEIRVPDLANATARVAVERLQELGLRVQLEGAGRVSNQLPPANTPILPGEHVIVQLRPTNAEVPEQDQLALGGTL